MNEKAGNMGLENTSFQNPHGLDKQGHYTTARDLALIMQNALKDPLLADIMATKKYTCVSSAGVERVFVNHNKLLSACEYCIGGKTGYTKADGRCLVSAAEKNGVRLIAVTLCAPNDWEDHKKLYAAGFDLYTEQRLCATAEITDTVDVVLNKNSSCQTGIANPISVYAFVRADKSLEIKLEKYALSAPVTKGETAGYAVFTQGKRVVARVELVTLESVEIVKKPDKEGFFQKIINFVKNIF
jgi:D-alanyl-D-alanine carboxypeptidase